MAQIQFNKELNGIVVGDKLIKLYMEDVGQLDLSSVRITDNAKFTSGDEEVMATVQRLELSGNND